MKNYFIKRGNKVKGPFAKSQLSEMYKSGKLNVTDQVREGQSGDWCSLKDFFAKPKKKSPGKKKAEKNRSSAAPLIAAGMVCACVLIGAGLYFSGLFGGAKEIPGVGDTSGSQKPDQTLDKVPEPVDAPEETWDLLESLNVEDYSVVGKWTKEGETLVFPKGSAVRIQIPYSPPEEYELVCEVEPLEPCQGLTIGLVSSGHPFHAIIDYLGQTRLEKVSQADVSQNASFSKQSSGLKVGQKATVRCVVKTSSVRVEVDDKTLVDWKGSPEQLSHHSYWSVPFRNALWLGGLSQYQIHSAKLKPITGKAIALLDQLPPRIVSETARARAEKIHGPVFRQLVELLEGAKQPPKTRVSYSGKPLLYFNKDSVPELTQEIMELFAKLQGPVQLNFNQMKGADAVLTVENFKLMGEMPQLLEVDLWNRHVVNGPRLQALAKSKSLENIMLDYQSMTDDEIAAICEMKSLLHLRIANTGMDDKKLHAIASGLPQLEHLSVGGWSKDKTLSEKTLAALSRLSKLKYLNIENCAAINDDAAQHLSKLQKLETLNVNKTELTFKGFKTLTDRLSGTSVSWEPRPVPVETDHSVPTLTMLEKFPDVQSEFQERFEKAKQKLASFKQRGRNGYLVIGRVQPEGSDSPESTVAQTKILKHGFFVTTIRKPDAPMGVHPPGYLPLLLVAKKHAKLNDDGIYDYGVIRFAKTPEDKLASVAGRVAFEANQLPVAAQVILRLLPSHNNSPFGGIESAECLHSTTATVKADGSFAFADLSPGAYDLVFVHDGFKTQFKFFQLRPAESLENQDFQLVAISKAPSTTSGVKTAATSGNPTHPAPTKTPDRLDLSKLVDTNTLITGDAESLKALGLEAETLQQELPQFVAFLDFINQEILQGKIAKLGVQLQEGTITLTMVDPDGAQTAFDVEAPYLIRPTKTADDIAKCNVPIHIIEALIKQIVTSRGLEVFEDANFRSRDREVRTQTSKLQSEVNRSATAIGGRQVFQLFSFEQSTRFTYELAILVRQRMNHTTPKDATEKQADEREHKRLSALVNRYIDRYRNETWVFNRSSKNPAVRTAGFLAAFVAEYYEQVLPRLEDEPDFSLLGLPGRMKDISYNLIRVIPKTLSPAALAEADASAENDQAQTPRTAPRIFDTDFFLVGEQATLSELGLDSNTLKNQFPEFVKLFEEQALFGNLHQIQVARKENEIELGIVYRSNVADNRKYSVVTFPVPLSDEAGTSSNRVTNMFLPLCIVHAVTKQMAADSGLDVYDYIDALRPEPELHEKAWNLLNVIRTDIGQDASLRLGAVSGAYSELSRASLFRALGDKKEAEFSKLSAIESLALESPEPKTLPKPDDAVALAQYRFTRFAKEHFLNVLEEMDGNKEFHLENFHENELRSIPYNLIRIAGKK